MGGSVNVPGNVTRNAEFNFYTDVDAIQYIVSEFRQVIIFPLDITESVCFYQALNHLKDLPKYQDNRFLKFWTELELLHRQMHILHDPRNIMALHDVLPALYVLNPQIFRFQHVYGSINEDAAINIDQRLQVHSKTPNLMIALSVKTEDLKMMYLTAMAQVCKDDD